MSRVIIFASVALAVTLAGRTERVEAGQEQEFEFDGNVSISNAPSSVDQGGDGSNDLHPSPAEGQPNANGGVRDLEPATDAPEVEAGEEADNTNGDAKAADVDETKPRKSYTRG